MSFAADDRKFAAFLGYRAMANIIFLTVYDRLQKFVLSRYLSVLNTDMICYRWQEGPAKVNFDAVCIIIYMQTSTAVIYYYYIDIVTTTGTQIDFLTLGWCTDGVA